MDVALDPRRYISITIDEARNRLGEREVPVVALLLNKHTIEYSLYFNGVYEQNDPTAHAEINAIREECKKIQGTRLDDYFLFVNLEPCAMCAQAISNARIERLYFGAYDIKSGGTESGASIFYQKSCHYKPLFYGGIMEKESGEVFSKFFNNIRNNR